MKFLDYNNEEKGFKAFDLRDAKDHLGKRICYVLSRDYDRYRGGYIVRHASIHSKRYSTVYIDEGHDTIDIREVLECGIED